MRRNVIIVMIGMFVFMVLGLAGCGGGGGTGPNTGTNTTHQMGGAIQGSPLSLTGTVTTMSGTAGNRGSSDGIGAAASFSGPWDITTEGTNLYVTDASNNTIRKIVISTGEVTTLAGTAGTFGSTDGIGAAARFNSPAGITTDGINLYVVESGNYLIRKIVIATGNVTTLAGTAGIFGSADGVGAAARFNIPVGITTDGTNLYVTDEFNHTIRKIVISTGTVTTLAGSAGNTGSSDGAGATAKFDKPWGITTDGVNIYVTNMNTASIRKIVISTGDVTTIAGTPGSYGWADGTGAAAGFMNPQGITTDGTNLYITDNTNPNIFNSTTNTIRKIVISTGAVTTLAGTGGTAGSSDGVGSAARFNNPNGIITDGTGLFVTDFINYTIRKIN